MTIPVKATRGVIRVTSIAEEGTVAKSSIALSGSGPADGNTITLNDGINAPSVFEFDTNDSVTQGNIAVSIGQDVDATMDTLIEAINTTEDLEITALRVEDAEEPTCMLAHNLIGVAGNESISKSGNNIDVSGMSGGLDTVTLRTLASHLETIAVNTTPSS